MSAETLNGHSTGEGSYVRCTPQGRVRDDHGARISLERPGRRHATWRCRPKLTHLHTYWLNLRRASAKTLFMQEIPVFTMLAVTAAWSLRNGAVHSTSSWSQLIGGRCRLSGMSIPLWQELRL